MPVIKDTVLRLQELGVDEFRIMNVEPSLWWRANAGGQTIGITEWLDYICGLLDWWYDNDIKMDLDVWSFWRGAAGSRYINIIPDGHGSCQREDKIPACRDACKTPYIDSDGRIVLCNAITGYTKAEDCDWGNVFRDDLHTILREGPFIDQCSRTVGQLKKQNPHVYAVRVGTPLSVRLPCRIPCLGRRPEGARHANVRVLQAGLLSAVYGDRRQAWACL